MTSVVAICNSALIKLGASTIMALTDGSKNANLCNAQYERLRDELLRAHGWNFAAARARLAQLAATPAFGFAFAYQMPADCLRAISVHYDDRGGNAVRYKIEGGKLLSDASEIHLRYVRAVTDPNDMDVSFREALAWKLAADLAIPITQSASTHELMRARFRDTLARARAVDAIEDFPESLPDSSWLAGRG